MPRFTHYAEAQLSLRSLRSIVAGQPPATAEKSATVLEAALLMKQQGKGALLVVDGSRLIGIFTERDALFRVIAARRDPGSTRLAEVMTPRPHTMPPGKTAIEALRLMLGCGCRHLPVVENGTIVGVVSRWDFQGHEQVRLDEETGIWERI